MNSCHKHHPMENSDRDRRRFVSMENSCRIPMLPVESMMDFDLLSLFVVEEMEKNCYFVLSLPIETSERWAKPVVELKWPKILDSTLAIAVLVVDAAVGQSLTIARSSIGHSSADHCLDECFALESYVRRLSAVVVWLVDRTFAVALSSKVLVVFQTFDYHWVYQMNDHRRHR